MRVTPAVPFLLMLAAGFAALHSVEERRPGLPAVLILPHHDIVKTVRQRYLADRAAEGLRPRRIVLVSPNHYGTGSGPVLTDGETFNLDAGASRPDRGVLAALRAAGVPEQPSAFLREHGIRLVLPDLVAAFPGASITPVIFKDGTSPAAAAGIAAEVRLACPDCLVVASVDFSHYQPAALAEIHDRTAMRALAAADPAVMPAVESDSGGALAFAAGYAAAAGAQRLDVAERTNSGVLMRDPDIETTTHFFASYRPGPPNRGSGRSFAVGGPLTAGVPGPLRFRKLGERTFWGTDAADLPVNNPSEARYLRLPAQAVPLLPCAGPLPELRGRAAVDPCGGARAAEAGAAGAAFVAVRGGEVRAGLIGGMPVLAGFGGSGPLLAAGDISPDGLLITVQALEFLAEDGSYRLQRGAEKRQLEQAVAAGWPGAAGDLAGGLVYRFPPR